jgi:hypothetical protein
VVLDLRVASRALRRARTSGTMSSRRTSPASAPAQRTLFRSEQWERPREVSAERLLTARITLVVTSSQLR